jgi:hypothetical protein
MPTDPELRAGGESLQFDRAETGISPDQVSPACSLCQQPIAQVYYQVNNRAACPTCLENVRTAFFGGSGLRRTMMAALLGVLAALLGMGIYFGIEALTQRHFGLVAIVVGLLVGGAVRKGAAGRGGWFYQLMAIALTYASISGSYLLVALHEYPEYQQAVTGQPSVYSPGSGHPTTAQSESTPAGGSEHNTRQASLPFLLTSMVIALVSLVCLSLAFPIMAGLENPILLLITGIALYEAWKMNKRPVLHITGPHHVEDGLTATTPSAPLTPGTPP